MRRMYSDGQVVKVVNKAIEEGEIEVGGSGGLPEIESGDAGKVLAVNSGETGAEWASIPDELPTIASGDAGKLLAVNSGETGVEWKSADYVALPTTVQGKTQLIGEKNGLQSNLIVGSSLGIASNGYLNTSDGLRNSVDASGIIKAQTYAIPAGGLCTVHLGILNLTTATRGVFTLGTITSGGDNEGSGRQYIRAILNAGLTILGFTECYSSITSIYLDALVYNSTDSTINLSLNTGYGFQSYLGLRYDQ